MAIKTPDQLKIDILAAFSDNDTGDILPIAARGFLDDAVDSLVPAHGGSAALDRLQWNATTGWTAVSAVSTQYLVVTRSDDFPTLKAALVGLLTLSDLWPSGERPPFIWLVTPTAFGWLKRSRITVSTRVDNSGAGTVVEDDVSFGRLPYRCQVDGVPFKVGRYRTSLARPVDAIATPDEAALRFEYGYAAPMAETPTVPRDSTRDG